MSAASTIKKAFQKIYRKAFCNLIEALLRFDQKREVAPYSGFEEVLLFVGQVEVAGADVDVDHKGRAVAGEGVTFV